MTQPWSCWEWVAEGGCDAWAYPRLENPNHSTQLRCRVPAEEESGLVPPPQLQHLKPLPQDIVVPQIRHPWGLCSVGLCRVGTQRGHRQGHTVGLARAVSSQRHWDGAVVPSAPRQEPAVTGPGSSRPDCPAPPGRVAPAAEGSKSPGTQGHACPRHPGGGLAPAGAGPGGAGGVRQRGRPRGSAGLKGRRRRRGEGDSAAGRAGSGRGCGDLLRSGRLHSLGPSSPVVGLSPAGPRAAAVPRWGLSPTALCSPQVQRWGASPLSRS